MSKSLLVEMPYPVNSEEVIDFLAQQEFMATEISVTVTLKGKEEFIDIPFRAKLERKQVEDILVKTGIPVEKFEEYFKFNLLVGKSIRKNYLE